MNRALWVALVAAMTGAAQPRYQIVDLGVLPGQTSSTATAMNNYGRVAGTSGSRAFLYRDCYLSDLGTLGGSQATALAINDYDTVAGSSTRADGALRAFSWSFGYMRDLGGPNHQSATVIDPAGNIAGIQTLGPSGGYPFAVRYLNGQAVQLPKFYIPVAGTSYWPISAVTAVNDYGQASGYFQYGSTFIGVISGHGFGVWEKIMGVPGLEHATRPMATNFYGYTAGAAGYDNEVRAFISRHPYSPATDLGTLGGPRSTARSINSGNWIVGWAERFPSSGPYAFISDSITMYDLNTLLVNGSGWLLKEAVAINNAGQIAGNGLHNGQNRAFLLIPYRTRLQLLTACVGTTYQR